ncbi:MAG: isoprenylcysteine carboxylmethyltransferase family protein [Bacteroidales bacterium]|nr:isoprenylcysteine carboxylmethyltransferase family protein [Bacteroidales bacterium]
MTLQALTILSLYGILGIVFFGVIIYTKMQGREMLGRPSMNASLQMMGKFTLFIPVLLLPAAAFGKDWSWFHFPEWLSWVATFVCFVSMLFLVFSLLQMGKFTKVGLPLKDEIELQTRGIYSLSRNPMYFGLFLLALASNLYMPNPFNLLATIIGILVHHQIIKHEEAFLEKQFGKLWIEYKSNVRRYF